MGYIDKQVAQYQKSLDAASSGATLRNAIRKLQEKSQIRDSLKPLRKRGDIIATPGRGQRTGTTNGDFTELSRAFHETVRELRSSDGLFVLQYKNVKTIVTDRATFTYLDYVPS